MAETAASQLDRLIAALRTEPLEDDRYPAAGPVAAVVAALAASLAASAADVSRVEWDEAGGARAQALTLRRRAAALEERDAAAYALAREALAAGGAAYREEDSPDAAQARDWRLGGAVKRAAEPPLELAATAADIAELAGVIAARGARDVRADAVIAAILASAAAGAAARLVEINLVVGGAWELATRARWYADAASAASAVAVALEG